MEHEDNGFKGSVWGVQGKGPKQLKEGLAVGWRMKIQGV